MNVKMPKIVDILTFISMIDFKLSCVEYVKGFITSRPGSYSKEIRVNKKILKLKIYASHCLVCVSFFTALSSFKKSNCRTKHKACNEEKYQTLFQTFYLPN